MEVFALQKKSFSMMRNTAGSSVGDLMITDLDLHQPIRKKLHPNLQNGQ